jgi:hypothetical protein
LRERRSARAGSPSVIASNGGKLTCRKIGGPGGVRAGATANKTVTIAATRLFEIRVPLPIAAPASRVNWAC